MKWFVETASVDENEPNVALSPRNDHVFDVIGRRKIPPRRKFAVFDLRRNISSEKREKRREDRNRLKK